MNKVMLIGRLTKDPDVRYTQGEESKCVARYTLAVDRQYKRDGDQTADFVGCVVFGKGAEFAERYLEKGKKIAVVGRIQTGSYTNREGNKVYTTDVVVENQEFVERANRDQNGNQGGQNGNQNGNSQGGQNGNQNGNFQGAPNGNQNGNFQNGNFQNGGQNGNYQNGNFQGGNQNGNFQGGNQNGNFQNGGQNGSFQNGNFQGGGYGGGYGGFTAVNEEELPFN